MTCNPNESGGAFPVVYSVANRLGAMRILKISKLMKILNLLSSLFAFLHALASVGE